MTKVEGAATRNVRRSPDMRRKQILDAAVQCVRRSGFHGATLSDISAEAGMSVGLIYRHFDSKDAIIEAIVEADRAQMRSRFDGWEDLSDDQLLEAWLKRALDDPHDPGKASLALEVLAEAARNPKVASIVNRTDAYERSFDARLCRRLRPDLTKREVEARCEFLALLFDGMKVRAASNPDFDRAALVEDLIRVMRFLLADGAMCT